MDGTYFFEDVDDVLVEGETLALFLGIGGVVLGAGERVAVDLNALLAERVAALAEDEGQPGGG